MTISTTDYWLRPEDGWTLVATNPTMLVIKPDAFHPWWVAATVSGAPNAAVAASQVLTLSGNAVAAETVTIDGVVYTFRAAPSVANEVAVGGTAAISITNLVADGQGQLRPRRGVHQRLDHGWHLHPYLRTRGERAEREDAFCSAEGPIR
jgi:hypothetical protein